MSSLIQIRNKLDLDEIRRKLEGVQGPAFWNSLEQIAETPEFAQYVEDEFPERRMDWADKSKRRSFLKLMGASLALAGVTACTKQPPEAIVPYVRQPEEFVPGKPLYYATAMPRPGGAIGILAESHLGRPTKIEGNPSHPSSLGATDAITQASVLDLYDPDRSQTVLRNGDISSWVNFEGALIAAREKFAGTKGSGLQVVSRPVESPTLAAQANQFRAVFPAAKWREWDPVYRPLAARPLYHLDRAKVILSLDADFLGCGAGSVRYAHEFAKGRRLIHGHSESMNRLYVVEGTLTITGASADHRIRMKPSEIAAFAQALAGATGAGGGAATVPERSRAGFNAIAKDLSANRGACLVMAGETQPVAVHAAAHAINQALGNIGQTVEYLTVPGVPAMDPVQSLRELTGEMNAGRVDTLFLLDVNPVYDAPSDLGFTEALKKVAVRVHLGRYVDETGALCHWHIPMAHYLEHWSDTRAEDGTASVIQPLIEPLFGGKSLHEIADVLLSGTQRSLREGVQETWQSRGGGDFDRFWQQALHDGFIPGTAYATGASPAFAESAVAAKGPEPAGGLEIMFRPDPGVWDGSYSNNAWLQEMPRPQSRMVWDNAIWISPATATRLGVTSEDEVELRYQGRSTPGPVWIMPGHADDAVTVHLGYGRTHGGQNSIGVGFNAYGIRTSDAMWNGFGAELRKTGRKHGFATTQYTYTMAGRDPVKRMTFAEYREHPQVEHEAPPRELTLYPDWKYDGYRWGMAIDLNSCIGCQACTVACQAENNIPVVGKDQVLRGRHMNWLRVDRYFQGKNLDDPEVYFEPVPCMHCETAPCELVCPVGATVHSGDGLNQMVYNRCVGTRYCSNNCPYKVRRFNFYLYSDWYRESLYGLRNPDVTVRSRGVMEKCTYCVQRIAQAKIESEKEDRRIQDGEIIPACAQSCPTQAIVFGDLNDPHSKVAMLKAQPRDYGLLEDLNTRPRTTYQARVKNLNPELERS